SELCFNSLFFFFQAEDGIRDRNVTGVQTCALPISFNDGTFTSARVLGTDPVTDLAVIKAEDESDLKPAKFGDSSDLTVGQQVVEIGRASCRERVQMSEVEV